MRVADRKKRHVLCIIAKDADIIGGKYRSIGPDGKLRTQEALKWQQEHIPLRPVTWAFGAGTDKAYSSSPTLAVLGEVYLRQLVPEAEVLSNSADKQCYGTYEEITWMIWKARLRYYRDDLEFVFFTQAQHMDRVRRVLAEFFPEVRARFVVTSEVEKLSWWKEWISHRKLTLLKWGVVSPRYRFPYHVSKIV